MKLITIGLVLSFLEQAVKESRTIFPKVPVGFPEGADSEDSTYLHCWLNLWNTAVLLTMIVRTS